MSFALIGLFLLGIGIGYFGPALLYAFQMRKQLKEMHDEIIPGKLDNKKLCQGPHTWFTVSMFTGKGEKPVQLCRSCGFISGTDKMASQEAIDKLEADQRAIQLEEKLYGEFLAREDEDIKQYFSNEISGGLDFEKLTHIHAAGMTFGSRFILYKKMVKKSNVRTEDEAFKGNA